VFGTQTPLRVQTKAQLACVVTVQAPDGAQQEPVISGRTGHGAVPATPKPMLP
jgi:hypothetical protein